MNKNNLMSYKINCAVKVVIVNKSSSNNKFMGLCICICLYKKKEESEIREQESVQWRRMEQLIKSG